MFPSSPYYEMVNVRRIMQSFGTYEVDDDYFRCNDRPVYYKDSGEEDGKPQNSSHREHRQSVGDQPAHHDY